MACKCGQLSVDSITRISEIDGSYEEVELCEVCHRRYMDSEFKRIGESKLRKIFTKIQKLIVEHPYLIKDIENLLERLKSLIKKA